MPLLQIRECPTEIYEAIAYDARRARRTIAQQALVYLEQALNAGTDTEGKRSSRITAFNRIIMREIPEAANQLDVVQILQEQRQTRSESVANAITGENQ